MPKEAFYFSHDSNARNDEKIVLLRMKHGWEGYGLFWAIIERLRECSDYMSVCDYNLIAYDLRVDSAKVKSIICEFGLFAFTEDGKCFYSNSLMERIPKSDKRKELSDRNGIRLRMYQTNVKEWYRRLKIVFERDKYTCQYCGQIGGKLEGDHVIPFSKGGSDDISNLLTACRKCNRQKKDKSVEEFLKINSCRN